MRPPSPVIARLDRRIWPLAVSVVYVVLGVVYEFRWGPIVRHVPSAWIAPGDLMSDYGTAIQFAQGHFSNVYAPGRGFLSYPGLLVALFPLAVINNVFHGLWINIKVNNVSGPPSPGLHRPPPAERVLVPGEPRPDHHPWRRAGDPGVGLPVADPPLLGLFVLRSLRL